MSFPATPKRSEMVKPKPFMVLAQIYTKSVEKVEIELELLKAVAEYEIHQDQCGSYIFLLPLEGDRTVLTLLEVYDDRNYMLTQHRESEPFRHLKEVEEEKDTRLKRPDTTALTPRGGFLEREEPSTVPLVEQSFWITRMKFTPETRLQALSHILLLAEHIYDQEKDALSFMVAEDAHDESSVVIFERFMGEKAFRDVRSSSDSVKKLQEELKPLLVDKTCQGYRAVRGFVSKKEALV